ncbi:helix-turn-helix domain-containing protein [Endozoicomonas lisbonensis]|uniref:Transcriptional regulator with XRE-family HTH domain n=1 Tax=Endozoicomonas lisbonensis TaxID=3120522 RepID=A0ABV2SES8_9GAMM
MEQLVDPKKIFGAKLRSHRKENGFSQEVLAERTGLSRVYISCLERGKQDPSLKVLKKLAHGLGINVSDLI